MQKDTYINNLCTYVHTYVHTYLRILGEDKGIADGSTVYI